VLGLARRHRGDQRARPVDAELADGAELGVERRAFHLVEELEAVRARGQVVRFDRFRRRIGFAADPTQGLRRRVYVFLFLGPELLCGGKLGTAEMRQHLAVGGDGSELAPEDLVEDAGVALLIAAAGGPTTAAAGGQGCGEEHGDGPEEESAAHGTAAHDSVRCHDDARKPMSKDNRRALAALAKEVHGCRLCPRLVEWREAQAANPPRRYRGEDYWARPVSGFGDPEARVAIVGLAPAAHGANRTGRMFTGDRSGDWLYASLHRTGFANQPESHQRGDGLELRDAYITATVRCAPPANKPTPEERDTCLPYLERELRLLARVRVIVALGAFGWDGFLRAARAIGEEVPRPRPKFGHGAEAEVGPRRLLGCYHPSQQNTFTGTLTAPMTDEVFERASQLAH
jgi:uracil-DNA glycosylase family 4